MELLCRYISTTHLTSAFEWAHTSLHTHFSVHSLQAQKSRHDSEQAWDNAAPNQMCVKKNQLNQSKTKQVLLVAGLRKSVSVLLASKGLFLLSMVGLGSGPSDFLNWLLKKRRWGIHDLLTFE